MGSLTAEVPKPLLSVGGKPFLFYLVSSLLHQGFDNLLLLAGYHAQMVSSFAEEFVFDGLSINCVIEDRPLGTGGALVNARDHLCDEFLLLNGDTLFDINLNDFLVPSLSSTTARIALRRVSNTARFGRVSVLGERVTSLNEKGVAGAGLINGGIYYLKKSNIDLLPVGHSSLEEHLLPALINSGRLCGREYSGFFLDIGIPDDFELAQTSVPESLRRPAAIVSCQLSLLAIAHGVNADDVTLLSYARAIKKLNDARFYVFVQIESPPTLLQVPSENRMSWTVRLNEALRGHGAHVDSVYFSDHIDFTCKKNAISGQNEFVGSMFDNWFPLTEDSVFIDCRKNTDGWISDLGIRTFYLGEHLELEALIDKILLGMK